MWHSCGVLLFFAFFFRMAHQATLFSLSLGIFVSGPKKKLWLFAGRERAVLFFFTWKSKQSFRARRKVREHSAFFSTREWPVSKERVAAAVIHRVRGLFKRSAARTHNNNHPCVLLHQNQYGARCEFPHLSTVGFGSEECGPSSRTASRGGGGGVS